MMEAVSEEVKSIRALPMQEERKPLLKDLNCFLLCGLCGGYLVEATGLVECLHSHRCKHSSSLVLQDWRVILSR